MFSFYVLFWILDLDDTIARWECRWERSSTGSSAAISCSFIL